jgi:hypothetical protein
MTTDPDSFRSWLRQEIQQILKRKSAQPPLLIWCDPDRVWRELLQAAAEGSAFELWADDAHELLMREKFYKAKPAPRVVWLPVGQEDITYFKVFELEASDLWKDGLIQALTKYGVDIPADHQVELKPLLPAHAKEWLDRPKSAWKELTYGTAKDTLIDDDRILHLLAGVETFDSLKRDNRFGVFARRVTEDFGLPAPQDHDADGWRVKAVAALLVTEAAEKCPQNPPSDTDRIIPKGRCRTIALKLLARWQKQVDLVDHFEQLAAEADVTTSLQYWAKNLESIPDPLSSPIAERTLFEVEIERLNKLDVFADLAKELDTKATAYQAHTRGFWGRHARAKVRWDYVVGMASIAGLLQQQSQIENGWKSPQDAVEWFVKAGWQVDQAGEVLFRDDDGLPGGLIKVRAKLRKAYLQKLAQENLVFSELLATLGTKPRLAESLKLSHVGDAIKETIEKASAKEPVAVVVLDACRYDLGCRLAALLNQGEPARRAQVSPAIAPIPSITALGMPFALPGAPPKLMVDLVDCDWRVTHEGFDGNLMQAQARREWLKKTFKLKDTAFLSIDSVNEASAADAVSVKSLGRLVFVFADEFDDHEGKLKPFGLDQTLDRYARSIRRLRAGGYGTVVVVTDHGFFHWQPESDEVQEKPKGDILWSSRRAVVGHELKHSTALALIASGSDLECRVPRSVDSFKTYGGLGFFHGGATLQELIIPVVTVHWPKKARKVRVVLKPITQIKSVTQKVEVASAKVQTEMFSEVDENLLARQVVVKVLHPATGKLLFKSEAAVTVEPGGSTKAIELRRVEGTEAKLHDEVSIQVHDADDEELLDRSTAKLEVELDEWF